MIKLFRVAAIAICAALAAPVAAQDYNAGLDAAMAGDFATALENWRPLAEQGDADAQGTLGIMYDTGQGVLQDDAELRFDVDVAKLFDGQTIIDMAATQSVKFDREDAKMLADNYANMIEVAF